MKTYTQLKEEAVQLDEIFDLFGLFGNRQTKDINKRIKTAAQQGPEAEAKERLNIFRELIGGMIRVVKAHPKAAAVTLGLIMADITIAGVQQDMYRAGIERREEEFDPNKLPRSVTETLARRLIKALGDMVFGRGGLLSTSWPYILGLIAAGFSLVGIYKLLRLLVVRGPEWIDALITTRDERALAYTLKKEFDTDVYTQSIRVGSPGQGKIGAVT